MLQRENPAPIDVAAYLAAERDSTVRHEYVGGQLYAMAGASDRHNRIALRLAALLDAHVGDGPCQVFMSDMKVRVAADVFYYPDVVVACDPPGGDPYIRSEPRLVVEILSPSTERIDRQEKRLSYAGVSSLVEYLLIDPNRCLVEVQRRDQEGGWSLTTFTQLDDVVELASVGVGLRISDLYRGVPLAT